MMGLKSVGLEGSKHLRSGERVMRRREGIQWK